MLLQQFDYFFFPALFALALPFAEVLALGDAFAFGVLVAFLACGSVGPAASSCFRFLPFVAADCARFETRLSNVLVRVQCSRITSATEKKQIINSTRLIPNLTDYSDITPGRTNMAYMNSDIQF